MQLKTAASEQPVPLPPFVTSRLIAHHAAQLRERFAAGVPTEDGLVFVTPRGLPVSHSWLTQHFQDLLAAAGLPKMRLHDLRHGAATLLLGAGVHPRVAQQLLPARLVEDDDRDLQPCHRRAGAPGGGGAGGGVGGVKEGTSPASKREEELERPPELPRHPLVP